MAKKPILCLDFDGVCNSYISGWQDIDNIPDPPVNGLFDFLEQAREFFDIVIFSSRSKELSGLVAMRNWFSKWYTEYRFTKQPQLKEKYSELWPEWIIITSEKPAAFLTIDDRAITFQGIWFNPRDLLDFKPWYKK